MYKVTPPVPLSPGELFLLHQKKQEKKQQQKKQINTVSVRSWHSCTATT